jgi:beta-glucosidase
MDGHTYRYFKGKPLFPFGHGLSYTTFAYEKLAVPASVTLNSSVEISFNIANTGESGGDEVVQVYLKSNVPGEPIKSLKWFSRRFMAKGAVEHITVNLGAADFAIFNESSGAVEIVTGKFRICVGGSSDDTRLICADVILGKKKDEPGIAVLIAVLAVAGAVLIPVVVAVIVC